MIAIGLLLWVLGGEADAITGPPGDSAARQLVPFRTGPELREAVQQGLRSWAKSGDEQAEAAARELLVLYRELQADRTLADRDRLRLRTKLRKRLLDLSTRITYRTAVAERKARPPAAEKMTLPQDKPPHLAQFGMVAGNQPGGAGDAQAGLFGGTTAPADGGRALVDLIQRTIAPQSWDVNGGPGSIYYWAPGHAIVVRQSDEVHRNLGGALQQLRRAGQ